MLWSLWRSGSYVSRDLRLLSQAVGYTVTPTLCVINTEWGCEEETVIEITAISRESWSSRLIKTEKSHHPPHQPMQVCWCIQAEMEGEDDAITSPFLLMISSWYVIITIDYAWLTGPQDESNTVALPRVDLVWPRPYQTSSRPRTIQCLIHWKTYNINCHIGIRFSLDLKWKFYAMHVLKDFMPISPFCT